MSEYDRFLFLVKRDGLISAREWETRTAEIYRISRDRAIDPELAGGCKGRKWAEIYNEGMKECELFAKPPAILPAPKGR